MGWNDHIDDPPEPPVTTCPACGARFTQHHQHQPDQPGNRWPATYEPLCYPCCGYQTGKRYDSEHTHLIFYHADPAADGMYYPWGKQPV